MSWDYNSSTTQCNHTVLLERYVVDQFDFRTLHYANNPSLNMRAPINGSSAVQVYFKGVLVPASEYAIVNDPAFSFDGGVQFKKIVFNQPQRMTLPLVEVTYVTLLANCIKCSGTGTVNDWRVNSSGAITRIHGREKLAQQALKYILTSRNPFNPSLTCPIRSYIGKKFGLTVTDQDISAAITTALSSYQQIQASQKTVQQLSPEETLKDITTVSAYQDPSNPLLIYVTLTITAYGSTNPLALNISLQSSNSGT